MKQSKKAAKRLEARIKDWADTVSRIEREKHSDAKGYHKPGSLKK